MDIRRVGVIGAGLMGSGIAEVCLCAEYDTLVREVDAESLTRGVARIEQSINLTHSRYGVAWAGPSAGLL